ncbi:hypothetical protein F5882DRAFT_433348 [Hyaloscypha sp. PMI_1271]|nr:hypothetical protein F5882DRAFT_433348 [Hyaloscypha sp. PMI_1271]
MGQLTPSCSHRPISLNPNFRFPRRRPHQFAASSTDANILTVNFSNADPAYGSIFIETAESGNALETFISPNYISFRLLYNKFLDHKLKIWDLETYKEEGCTVFRQGIYIPLNPFLGVVSLAREEAREGSTIPPYKIGRNINYKYITINRVLFLLIKVKAQGYREVYRAVIRTLINITVKSIQEKGLTRGESYILSSIAANLKIIEAVDMPHFRFACSLPLGVFVGSPYV